jgi:hypothetical protein
LKKRLMAKTILIRSTMGFKASRTTFKTKAIKSL